MQVFLTGASGLVGSAVARALKAKGHQVVGLTSKPENTSKLQQLGVEPVVGDIRDFSSWRDRAAAAEAIIHCAQLNLGRVTASAQKQTAEADGKAVELLIEAASPKCKALVYTSGGWVYGHDPNTVKDETAATRPFRIVDFKPGNEAKIVAAAKAQRAPGMVFRPGMVYGTRGPFEELVLRPLSKGKKASYAGNGAQYFSYIHEDDLARAFVSAIESPKPGEVFNVTDNEPVTAKAIAEEAARHMSVNKAGGIPGFMLKLVVGGLVAEPLLHSVRMTNKKFVAATGWQPQFPTYREGTKALAATFGK
ncbi:MAG: NAD-dependent epimerase/dehydratase family protein [Deltaproteobacteria bacterium]|nr:NAD-dependent epimerase/dehydratase family protein [Deltaproteobacteria bacterium]